MALPLHSHNAPQGKLAPAYDGHEQALLGRLLTLGTAHKANPAFEQIADLKPSDFTRRAHGLIWHAMKEIFTRGDAINITSVEAELNRPLKASSLKAIDEVTPAYLETVRATTTGNIPEAAKLIRRSAARRKLQQTAKDIEALAHDPQKTEQVIMGGILDLIGKIQLQVQALDGHAGVTLVEGLEAAFNQVVQKQRDVSANKTMSYGWSSGLKLLDAIIHGFKRMKLYVIAARPGVGKSALGLFVALEALRQGARVVFIPLEMGVEEMMTRALAIESGISGSDLETGNVSLEELELLQECMTRLQACKASHQFHFLTFPPNPTMMDIEAKLHQHMTLFGADLIVFDQLSPEAIAPHKMNANEKEVLTHGISRLKGWANLWNVPVVSMAQFNREAEKMNDGEPLLSHLAASDAVGRTADVVIAIQRYDSTVNAERGEIATLHVLKQRGGRKGKENVCYIPQLTKFEDLQS